MVLGGVDYYRLLVHGLKKVGNHSTKPVFALFTKLINAMNYNKKLVLKSN